MAALSVFQLTKNEILATPFVIGQILYCVDDKSIYFDNVDGSRGITTSIISVPNEMSKDAISNPNIKRLYLVLTDSKIYRYAGGWVEIVDTAGIVDILYEAGHMTPAVIKRGGVDIAPATLASLVYTADGLNIEAILASLMQCSLKSNRLGFKIEKTTATQDNQTEFNIPFPFPNYISNENGLLIFIGSTLLDDSFYTINDTVLEIVANYNIESGMDVTFVFLYNTNDKPISSEYINGINIAPYSIPTSRLQSITDSTAIDSSSIVASSKAVHTIATRMQDIIEKGQPVISNKMAMTTSYVNTTADNQTEFIIPFPFEKYMEYGNNFLVFIGTSFIDDRRYGVVDDTIVFNEGVDLGRTITFVFFYNTAAGNGAINPNKGTIVKPIVNFREISVPGSWRAITYGKGLFVAVTDEPTMLNKVMTSPDGENWTLQNCINNVRWQDVIFGNGSFVAVGKNQENLPCVMTSVNGVDWELKNSSDNTSEWVSVAYGNKMFVAVAEQSITANQKIMISVDNGETWLPIRSPITQPLLKVLYGNGIFAIVNGSYAITSTNGINWTVKNITATDMTYCNGTFYFLETLDTGESYFGNTEDFEDKDVNKVTGKIAISITTAADDIIIFCDRSGSSNNIILTNGYSYTYDIIKDSEYEYNKFQFAYGNGLMIGVKPQSGKVIVSGSLSIPELYLILK